ncbi:hypothetical protein Tco_1478161 [Tanacetum coccineum]
MLVKTANQTPLLGLVLGFRLAADAAAVEGGSGGGDVHGGCEGGAAAAVTVDGGDGDDRDGVAVTCGGVKAAGDDGVEGVVVRGDGIGGVVLSGGCGSRRGGECAWRRVVKGIE